MNKKLVYKILLIVLIPFFMVLYFSDILYAAQDKTKEKSLKIFWQNRDITQKLYPAIGKGKVYIIESNFIREVLGYSMQAPLFKKNDKGEWSQLALHYGIEKPSLHERIFNIRIYTGSTLVSITSSSGISNYNMKLPSQKCKKRYGDAYFIDEERKRVPEGNGHTYKSDEIVKIEAEEYFLHYVSLEDICEIFNKELIYDKENNIFKISNK